MKNLQHFIKLFGIAAGITCSSLLFAQDATNKLDASAKVNTSETSSSEDLSLEDILNLKVVSASKVEESVFESPLSVTTITREDIQRAGITAIPEIFRLVPGAFVREEANGNYEVALRGFDNIYNEFLATQSISTVLVMIDNRIVYSYFRGGMFWETLPIGLDDIDRVEVIRGPASALYGPNAVSGVVNIFTKKPEKDGFSTWGTATMAYEGSRYGNASFSYAKKGSWNVTANVNHSERDRFTTDYYNYPTRSFMQSPTSAPNSKERYPEPELALRQLGTNLFGNYSPIKEITLDAQTGYQRSRGQNVYFDNVYSPLTTRDSETYYGDLKAKGYGFSAHVAYMQGVQDALGNNQIAIDNIPFAINQGPLAALAGVSANFYRYYILGAPSYNGIREWDYRAMFHTWDADLEYEYLWKGLRIRPGIIYREAIYDVLYLRGEKILSTAGVSLRLDYKWNDWRFVAAGRYDKYNTHTDPYISYQLAVTKSFSDNHLVRVVHSRANKSPAMTDQYLDENARSLLRNTTIANIGIGASLIPSGTEVYGSYNIPYYATGDLPLLTLDLYELGYRVKPHSSLLLDTEIFYNIGRNFSGTNQLTFSDFRTSVPIYVQVVGDMKQYGATSSLTHVYDRWLQNNIYATLQHTDYTRRQTQDKNYTTTTHRATPTLYGGFRTNARLAEKWNINVNPYIMTSQKTRTRLDSFLGSNSSVTPDNFVPTRFVVNARVSYDIYKNLTVFINARNALFNNGREYANVDEVEGLYYLGVNASY